MLVVSFCGNERASKLCGKCQVARYCSVDCQRSHWKTHKHLCQLRSTSFQSVCYDEVEHRPSVVIPLGVLYMEDENGPTFSVVSSAPGIVDRSKIPSNVHGDREFYIKVQNSAPSLVVAQGSQDDARLYRAFSLCDEPRQLNVLVERASPKFPHDCFDKIMYLVKKHGRPGRKSPLMKVMYLCARREGSCVRIFLDKPRNDLNW